MRLSDAFGGIKYSGKIDGENVFRGDIDPEWRVGAVPHGGYLLGLLFSAVRHVNRDTPHPDVIHLTAHFLNSSALGPFEIRVHEIRRGKTFANLEARLFQKFKLCITTHFICGILPDTTSMSTSKETLLAPSPLARTIPIRHPFHSRLYKPNRPYLCDKQYLSAKDDDHSASNELKFSGKGNKNDLIKWASWFTMIHEEQIDESMIPFIADMFANTPQLLPKGMRANAHWFPSVTMSVEFKTKIPRHKKGYAPRTMGLYTEGRFLVEGRHEIYAEVWTAPKDLDEQRGYEGELSERWKDDMRCLAISHQMALTFPEEVNARKAEKSKL